MQKVKLLHVPRDIQQLKIPNPNKKQAWEGYKEYKAYIYLFILTSVAT